MTTKTEIREWLERGKEQGASHLLVICDTYDWDDYPVFKNGDAEQIKEEVRLYPNRHDMQKVMEVYRLDMDFDQQLQQHRAFNY